MFIKHNPAGVAAPTGLYTHAMEAPSNMRWLYISGQVGVRPDGTISNEAKAQSDQVWQNIHAILQSAGMTFDNLVKFNTYLTSTSYTDDYVAARNVRLEGRKVASTTVFVSALFRPEWLVEVEAVAAAPN